MTSAAPGAPARVLIVADDLTGALDTAGPFAQQGLVTKVVAQPMQCDADSVSGAQVVSVNTASRHLPADAAAIRVRQCAQIFSGQRFDHVFKKIDSTLRGNVVAETIALIEASGRRSALVAPAFPAQGRTVKDGVVHVEGVPLAQTGFAKDALSPPPLQPLGEVFGAIVGADQVRSWRPGEDLPPLGGGVVIADAGSEEDMSELFDKALPQSANALFVGSAGFGVELARYLGQTEPMRSSLRATQAPILFVVGSRAARSREQVEHLAAQPATVVLEAPDGVTPPITDPIGAQQLVLRATEGGAGEVSAVDVAHRLTKSSLDIAAKLGAEAIVVTGGDTAIALLEASACSVIEVCGNLMPGIPFSALQWNGRSVYLVTKAGGFGEKGTMVDIVQCLRSGVPAGTVA